MAKNKREQKYLNEFRKSVLALGKFYFKIPDTLGYRFMIPKPFDSFIVSDGMAICVEGKAYAKMQSINYNDLRDSQKEGLDLALKNGAICLVLAFMKAQRGKSVCFIVPFAELRLKGKMTLNDLRSAIKLEKTNSEELWRVEAIFDNLPLM